MKKLIFFSLFLIFFCNCDKNSEVTLIPLRVITELPVYYVNNNSSTLITEKDIDDNVLILNSEIKVKDYFSDTFLHEYPEYLDVDFSKYSLLIKTSWITYKVSDRKIHFYLEKTNHQKIYKFQVDYSIDSLSIEEGYYIERIAIVVNKIDTNSVIEFWNSSQKVN